MEEKTFVITDAEGNEVMYEIVLTFNSPETNKDYVIYKEVGDTEDVLAAEYKEGKDGEGELFEIETDSEYKIIQDVMDAFMDDAEEE